MKFLSTDYSPTKDVSNVKPGMYFITITSLEGNITKKFIKN
ncbi:T9SS type A sorting domain-containing protein [Aequorivita vladivostokensis]|jgi:hypothetical protein|nr:T9SS type A sorting domain-containing protein [Aequorivita vladivostokensis]MAB58032.1 T9SS C-terminal target domain-containing protein [Aequorivita sp.]MAO48292.1 T9SS C-terminal target domain-containing protein [Aequorivita sp.]MBF30167.1 T9SS C-terminal target domain-containing protein [Aequorivita sp.]HAV55046.1 T9SS C-terminal target domain-containing protein [Aequorivita sp.]HBL80825.1 T9SS C-terminal target domain-containing protein [Aequorivita sp.]|tara:strand:- start:368659 stop:368781 length:123 start_codon:yes stop_codon:yes gene_type:complete